MFVVLRDNQKESHPFEILKKKTSRRFALAQCPGGAGQSPLLDECAAHNPYSECKCGVCSDHKCPFQFCWN